MNKFISILVVSVFLIVCTSDSQVHFTVDEVNAVPVDTNTGNMYLLGGITGKLPVDKYSSKYDVYFTKYSKRFFGVTYEWRYFKAQAVAESALNPDAVSPVGARSLMQVMPRTWNEIIQRHSFIQDDPFNHRWAIAAGISYDKTLYNQWKAKRSEKDRIALTMASYNCGLGNVLKGQQACRLLVKITAIRGWGLKHMPMR